MINDEHVPEGQSAGAANTATQQAAADPTATLLNIAAEETGGETGAPSLEAQTGEELSADAAPEQPAAGEGLLDKVTGMLPEGAIEKASALLDQDGDGNPIDDIAGFAGKLLGRN